MIQKDQLEEITKDKDFLKWLDKSPRHPKETRCRSSVLLVTLLGKQQRRKMKVWVVTGTTESGDTLIPEVFTKEPTDESLKEICDNWDPGPRGPGNFESYVYLEIYNVEVDVYA
jgi:hypothetical protein